MTERYDHKVKDLDELKFLIEGLKKKGKKVVHCHGVFDLLHLGHIRHLNSAKTFGDTLVVSITADRYVKRGPGRPVFKEKLRAEALANLEVTDFVCVLDYPTAIQGILAIKPDFYVKGPDYKKKEDDLTAKIFDEQDAVESVGGQLVFTDDFTFSSSKLLNAYFDTYPEHTINYLKELSTRYSTEYAIDRLKEIQQLKVLVVGDSIIDQYHYCTPLGKSSKESLVANKYLSKEDFAGGCFATANNTAQLTRNVELLTILGEKDSFEDFVKRNLDPYMKPHLLMRPNCVSTVKRRYVSSNRKLFEVCFIDDHPLSVQDEQRIVEFLEHNLDRFDLVIVSDFGHGLITNDIKDVLCDRAKCLALNVQTNSANYGFNMVTKYRRADFICIDERELRLAVRDRFGALPDLLKKVYHELDCKQIIATKGAEGSLAYNEEDGFHDCPAFTLHSIDTVGAGDAFFAYTAPCFAMEFPQDLLSLIGNAVGGLKVQIVGNREPVKFPDLGKFVTRLLKM